ADFEPPIAPLSRAEAGRSAIASAASAERRPRDKIGYWQALCRAGWISRSAGSARALGPGRHVFAVRGSRADRHATEPRYRTGRRLHPDAPGTYRAKHPGNLAGVAGNSGGG